jgi:hypothetical protein
MMAAAPQKQIIFKLDEGLMEQIDRFTQWLNDQQKPGLKVSRTDAIRVLLYRGLGAFSADEGFQGEQP